MKVLFIYPDIIDKSNPDYTGIYYTGIGSLAANLEVAGHQTSLLHCVKEIDREDCLKKVEEEKPGLIAFSTTTNQFEYVKKWAKWIKEHFDIKIICGGIHAVLYPDEVICCKDIDIVCIGEGEECLTELVYKMENNSDITNVPNLWIKSNGTIYKNKINPLIQNLDSLPYPKRDIFDYPNLVLEKMGRATMMASRGCPYDCAYCCNKALKNKFKNGKYVRFRSVDHVINEIKQLKKNYSFVKAIHFDDDILPLKKSWFQEFSEKYSRYINLPYSCNLRPNLATPGIIEMLSSSGCFKVHFGIESGNVELRNNLLQRKITNEQLEKAFSLCREAGFETYSYNMVGLPDENMRKMLETVKLNAKLKSDIMQVSVFYPYQETDIYEECKKRGLLTSNILSDYMDNTILNFSPLQIKQILFVRKHFKRLVNIYKRIEKLSEGKAAFIKKSLDRVLCAKYFAIFFIPLINFISTQLKTILTYIRKHQNLYQIAKLIRRAISSKV